MATTTSCGLPIDSNTLEMDTTKTPAELKVKNGVVSLPIATDAVLGGVIPDGTVITVSETGAITVPVATETTLGVVSVDGDIITITEGGEITVADASTTVKGVTLQATNQAISTATTVELLLADFNALLLKLKTAGIMVADV